MCVSLRGNAPTGHGKSGDLRQMRRDEGPITGPERISTGRFLSLSRVVATTGFEPVT